VIVGNPFPVIEHPFQAQKNYNGKPINVGYQSHFTLGMHSLTFFNLTFSQLIFMIIKQLINIDNKNKKNS